jgi:agmatinase
LGVQGRPLASMGEIFERGIVAVIDNVLTEIADAEHLFLSIDINVLDPAYARGHRSARAGWYDLPRAAKGRAPANGRARSRGDGPRQGLAAYDHAGITAVAAHRAVSEALSSLALNRRSGKPKPENP